MLNQIQGYSLLDFIALYKQLEYTRISFDDFISKFNNLIPNPQENPKDFFNKINFNQDLIKIHSNYLIIPKVALEKIEKSYKKVCRRYNKSIIIIQR